jgi:hypothetical protein
MKPNNPFLVTGYLRPEFFCNRESETGKLLSAIMNERNLTITSIRRMGKTDLIKHVFYKLRNDKNYRTVYVDLQPTSTSADFVRKIGQALFRSLGSSRSRWFNRLIHQLSGLRPKITFDTLTGQPSVQLDIVNEEVPVSIEKIFDFISTYEKKVVLAFDEFQQIIRYPEKNIQALLRSHIQGISNLSCIFSGSHRNILASMFEDYSQPFYQSADMIYLDKIDPVKYKNFITTKFRTGKSVLASEIPDLILEKTRNHTYYVQYFCNQLYSSGYPVIDHKEAELIWSNILDEREGIYYDYRNLFTDLQFNVLKAIASEGSINKPLSAQFLHRYGLPTPSSVKTALNALLDREFIHYDRDEYFVTDVFLSEWLREMTKI